jgi:hypothetical protein
LKEKAFVEMDVSVAERRRYETVASIQCVLVAILAVTMVVY